jgi:hypothetical protein
MKKVAGVLVAALALIAMTAGCSQKYSAERDGKKAGKAICDVKDADSAEEAQAAADDVREQLDDLASKAALFTAEDRQDIENNLADLAEHSIQGNDLLVQQDIAVLERSVDNIRDDASEVSSAAWEGVLEGLSTCTD